MLDNCLIDTLSIKIYKNQFFRSDFWHIHVYVFRLSFLTTLNIYKDYFKGRQRLHKCEEKLLFMQIVTKDILSSSFS